MPPSRVTRMTVRLSRDQRGHSAREGVVRPFASVRHAIVVVSIAGGTLLPVSAISQQNADEIAKLTLSDC